MSPILHFNFVSKLYSGSISDKETVNASGFLEQLQPGDAVTADKGFNIQDYLALHETVLIAPPIISARASTATRRVATARFYIERTIKQLKSFKVHLTPILFLSLNNFCNFCSTVVKNFLNVVKSMIFLEISKV